MAHQHIKGKLNEWNCYRNMTRNPNLINSGNNNLLYMILKPKCLEPEVEVGIRN